MALTSRHVMESNMRLLNQIDRDLFGESTRVWQRVFSDFCKEHGALMPNRLMQFKYKGTLFFIPGDEIQRSGVQPLHPSLVERFEEAYKMFVVDVNHEKSLLKNMVSHAIRIAKTAEDLMELLPECMHHAITESGFFQLESKPTMSIDDVKLFNQLYSENMNTFDVRKFLGASM